MRESSGSAQSTRSEVAPPVVTSKPVQRTGYAVLAASGLVLATVFGGIAELATNQQSSGATGELASSPEGSPRGGQGALGKSDDDRTRTVDGVAVAENVPDSSTAAPRARAGSAEPTTVVRIGPDGEPTTTTITPSKPPERSGRDDSTGHPGAGEGPGDTGTGDSSTPGSSTGDGGGTSTDNGGGGDGTDTTSPGGGSETDDPGETSTTTTTPITSSSTPSSGSTTPSTQGTSSSTPPGQS